MPTIQPVRKVALAILAGPIKYWWDDNWDTPEHWHYDAWREALSAGLVADGSFLVYRPHHAYKGTWTERGQSVNDAALKAADVVIDMTPPGIPSEGTVSEIKQASSSGAVIVQAPPPATQQEFNAAIKTLIDHLATLGIHRDMVDQDEVLECIAWEPGRDWLVKALTDHYGLHVQRLPFHTDDGGYSVVDAYGVFHFKSYGFLEYFLAEDFSLEDRKAQRLEVSRLLKIEILSDTWN